MTKVKVIRIYKFEAQGNSPYGWMKQFRKLEETEPQEPFQEFATEDKPKGWLNLIKGR